MLPHPESWALLHRTADLAEARVIVTTVAAMEFEVVLSDAAGHRLGSDDAASGTPPFSIHVPREHFSDLRDILDELLVEQREFDERIERRREFASRLRRRTLIGFIIAALAVLVYIKLVQS